MDEQALQFAAEDNAKVLWDKIRATFIGEGEDREIDEGNELKNIRMKNGETVADYIARARGISTWTGHVAEGIGLPYPSHREEKLSDNTWILDSGASCHMAKESVWFKKISPEVMDIYLADTNSKMMSQGTGNVSAKTLVKWQGRKRANHVLLERARSLLYESKLPLKFWAEAINCSTQVSNVTPRKGKEKIPLEIWTGEIENETWDIDSFFENFPERNEINQNAENGVLSNFYINNGPAAILRMVTQSPPSDDVIASDRQNPNSGT
ncbi:retrovirus-related Pol polyprotein from transposon TNT 1-94 [Trichonephila clavipes]|nr:retrovirus-related Pol polyprotein from transposon TNT 1-94 [Trichonephila clavipes]